MDQKWTRTDFLEIKTLADLKVVDPCSYNKKAGRTDYDWGCMHVLQALGAQWIDEETKAIIQ